MVSPTVTKSPRILAARKAPATSQSAVATAKHSPTISQQSTADRAATPLSALQCESSADVQDSVPTNNKRKAEVEDASTSTDSLEHGTGVSSTTPLILSTIESPATKRQKVDAGHQSHVSPHQEEAHSPTSDERPAAPPPVQAMQSPQFKVPSSLNLDCMTSQREEPRPPMFYHGLSAPRVQARQRQRVQVPRSLDSGHMNPQQEQARSSRSYQQYPQLPVQFTVPGPMNTVFQLFRHVLLTHQPLMPPEPLARAVDSSHINEIVHAMWQTAFIDGPRRQEACQQSANFSYLKLQALANLNYLPSWWYYREIVVELMRIHNWVVDDRVMQTEWSHMVNRCEMLQQLSASGPRLHSNVGSQEGVNNGSPSAEVNGSDKA